MIDEYAASGSCCIRRISVIGCECLVQARGVDTTIKLSQVCSGDRISHRPVTGEIGTEDFTSRSEVRSDQPTRKRTIKVGDHLDAESARYIGISAKRQLVSAIQERGAEETTRFVIIHCLQHEVLITIRRRACQLRTASVIEA